MEKSRRIIVLGDSSVGKSSLIDTLFSEFLSADHQALYT